MKLLYLHGLGSGAESRTPRTLRVLLPDDEIFAPEIQIDPIEAYDYVLRYVKEIKPDTVLGTSLGGFYTMGIPGVRKLLVNPAMHADENIEKGIGLGTQPFFLPHSDGATSYVIDRPFIEKLETVRRKICAVFVETEREKTYALFGTSDTLLDHYDDFCALCGKDHAKRFDGEHRLSPGNIERDLLPCIISLTEKQ